ncbi:tetratricopeptide repeat protein [Methylomonas sp. LL1]|uniref:tetratricopeptide repeat protein n=1 Tax=Methylomonas sp. LL1 TaxID=2785785 RepID=UPI0018C39193|nr:tetratricopeptide repeat protein [Methylomonas sp. LL1]QPK63329.1 tetratricopeptide repeat protein [Methylomonas sp. LL1]
MTIEDQSSAETVDLDYALAVAIRLHQTGQLEEAETLYRTILQQFPNYPEALHFLGLLMHQREDNDQAIALIEQALAEAPDYSDAHNNLGNIFNKLGHVEKAADSYGRALDLNPQNAVAYNNFGLVLSQLSQLEDAIEAFSRAVELMPNNPEFYQNLGNAFKKQGNFVNAIDAYRKLLSLRPYNAKDYEELCAVLYLQGSVEEAIVLVKQWLEYEPNNPLALHRLYSYSGELSVPRAADEYITQTFDGFADSFDMVLKNLDYKAPFLVADVVKQIHQQTGKALTILDAGCGTGLCGPLIKPYAQKIIGVDLSAKMLDKAEKRGCYDELFQSELTAFISACFSGCDVIVSADTLVYFGDLEPVCRAAARALLPGGHLVFTVERSEDSATQDYKIQQHGRFSHSEAYIRNVIKSTDLSLLRLEKVMLRYEAGVEVDGFLVVAVKVLHQ